MLPPCELLRQQLHDTIAAKEEQGHIVTDLTDELARLPASYDAFLAFAQKLSRLPLRPDWDYVEPSDLAGIWSECEPDRPTQPIATIAPGEAAARVETAFLSSVCGCILGKPLEINPTLDELQRALQAIGEWPLDDYVSEKLAPHLPRAFHGSWPETVREQIRYAAPDDDINYTIMGMLVLERHGLAFTQDQLRNLWLEQLPVGMTFGPERVVLLRAGLHSLGRGLPAEAWADLCNPREEFCGALIRADAYGYACPGNPALAAELAWRDASFTHRRTGIYGTMFVAAAIACAPVIRDRLEVFRLALKFVPRRSRFYRIVADSLNDVRQARDWLDGYGRIHGKYWQYTHCRVFQEVGTLINTLRFAANIGDGLCKQVMQGNDTDSFGATAGSVLGAYFGPGHLDERWLRPLNDDLRTALAQFHERSLQKVAQRMGALPATLARGTATVPGKVRDAAAGL